MNQKNVVIKESTYSFWTILGLIFITLKLTGTIAWSWWWVLAPFWMPAVTIVLIVLIAIIIATATKRN